MGSNKYYSVETNTNLYPGKNFKDMAKNVDKSPYVNINFYHFHLH